MEGGRTSLEGRRTSLDQEGRRALTREPRFTLLNRVQLSKIAMGAFPALLSVLMLHTFSFSHVACAVPHLALHTPHTRTKAFTFVYYINIPG